MSDNGTTSKTNLEKTVSKTIKYVSKHTNTESDSKEKYCKGGKSSLTSQKAVRDFGKSESRYQSESDVQLNKKNQSATNKNPTSTRSTVVEMNSRKSITSDELPTYLNQGAIKSGKGPKIGSESLITDNVR
jgi:hypothetical protein